MGSSHKRKQRQKAKKSLKDQNSVNSKRDLVKIVDELKAQRQNNIKGTDEGGAKGEEQSENGIIPSNQELGQFEKIFAHFRPGLIENNGTNGAQFTRAGNGDHKQNDNSVNQVATLMGGNTAMGDTDNDSQAISVRKKRQQAKPTLADLKSMVIYPELIQWFDCDGPNPLLLTKIKSSKNVVSVPSHWQLKREYLSGRSVLAKKPFELPDIIRHTNIEEMRNTLPQEATEERSLKESSRARIRPKLGSLDLDYRKLHDAFFKIGRHWKPDYMLPYGDLFYENRNLEDERKWRKMERSLRPGRLSKDLRAALGLPEGKLPPWCSKFNELGMPPSYSDYKVAGVNWDISNLHGDVYGSLESNRESPQDIPLFGQIVHLDSDSDNDIDEGDLNNEQVNTDKSIRTQSVDKDSADKEKQREDAIRAESMKEVLKRRKQNQPERLEGREQKRLYSVIEQKDEGDKSQLTGNSTIYDIGASKRALGEQDSLPYKYPSRLSAAPDSGLEEKDPSETKEKQKFRF
ncbi:LADA_0F01354g1_1 [Lachancea dasiensis]|uniref:LADA_0F01354g1_1 n=1 Tax=Lachancea dasiensis TaxID=1072105 RepID=A0A1G4JIA6_9SACH|nr:LADA_0F01354g1_1 [Lachancea dasiensis]